MYAALWEEDRAAKCRREEAEAALLIERNREMLKVLTLQSAAVEKQKEEMKQLKEKEDQLLVCAALYMINTQTLEKDKGKIYKSNPKATTFQRKIAASGGTLRTMLEVDIVISDVS